MKVHSLTDRYTFPHFYERNTSDHQERSDKKSFLVLVRTAVWRHGAAALRGCVHMVTAKREQRPMENMILLLVLLRKAAEKGYDRLTRTQIHKFFFLMQRRMWRKKILATGFRFHKMPQGPWSTEVEKAIEVLKDAELITTTSASTRRGVSALMTGITYDGEQISDYELEHMQDSPGVDIVKAIEKSSMSTLG